MLGVVFSLVFSARSDEGPEVGIQVADTIWPARPPQASRAIIGNAAVLGAALKYTNRPDIAHEALANRTIELAKNGVLDPDRLCERVLDDLRNLPPHL